MRDVQSFLGFIPIYGEFISNSTHLTAPLYHRTVGKKGTDKVSLNADELAVFQSLKPGLCSNPQLTHPDLLKQFVVHTDASKYAVGAVLVQRSNDNIERLISFYLKKLLSPQLNYSMFERECLAIVAAITHLRVYLLARPFVRRTDHKALTWLFSKEPKAIARISSWIARLLEYSMVVEYIKGTENTNADVLSRFKNYVVDQIVPPALANGTISFACPASEADRLELTTNWLNEQRGDLTTSRVMRCIDAVFKPDADELELNPYHQQYLDVWNTLVVESGYLRHVIKDRNSLCIVVSSPLRDEVVRSLHLPAHYGFESTLRLITQRFWWHRIRKKVSKFV